MFIVLQVGVLVLTLNYFSDTYVQVQMAFTALAVVASLYIINQEGSSAFKIAWILPIVFMPFFGIPLYFFFGKKRVPERLLERINGMALLYREAMSPLLNSGAAEALSDPDAALQSAYLERSSASPAFTQTETTYYALGDTLFPAMLAELERAERYIFMEYFIIEEGEMWNAILDVLRRKAAQGVGRAAHIRRHGLHHAAARGTIRGAWRRWAYAAATFHRFQPVPTGTLNKPRPPEDMRHRRRHRLHGRRQPRRRVHQPRRTLRALARLRDKAPRPRGLFLRSHVPLHVGLHPKGGPTTPNAFLPEPGALEGIADDGVVQPYCDSPSDDEPVGERAYINMISRAQRYVYICTPYLVVDNEIMNALASAAKCGVDVRIICPHVPDKWYVHLVTRSYYAPLLRAGVRIYEYTPGFIHSKTFVCDDVYGVCGTINLDYRSLFLHHECAVWLYKSSAIADMKAAYLDTLEKSGEVTAENYRRPWYVRLGQSLLRVFAPLM